MATRRQISPEEIRLRLAQHLKVHEVPAGIWRRLVEGEYVSSLQARPDEPEE